MSTESIQDQVRAAERAADMTGRPFCLYACWDGSITVDAYDPARVNDILETVHPSPVKDPFDQLPL